MSDDFNDIPAFRRVEDQLTDALQRSVDRERQKRHAVGRRIRLGVAIGALLAAGTAGALELISSGTPVKDRPDKKSVYRPDAGQPVLDVSAPDLAGGVKWGVATYTSRSGQACAIAGVTRLGNVGLMTDGVFHPLVKDTAGPCGNLGRQKVIFSPQYFAGRHPRTLVYGRVAPSVKKLVLSAAPKTYATYPGPRGAFLFVLNGNVKPQSFRIEAYDAGGHKLSPAASHA
ncbi:MAG: hypothetical protein QOJ29_1513 [Thermoleophilaceae bacterium]|nr:hypothetical protein [Thermoleophilaceae bacterium]